jgi:hypothetical protein
MKLGGVGQGDDTIYYSELRSKEMGLSVIVHLDGDLHIEGAVL